MEALTAARASVLRRSCSTGVMEGGNFVKGLKNGLSSAFSVICRAIWAGTRCMMTFGCTMRAAMPSRINSMVWPM